MNETVSPQDDRLLTEQEVAERWGIGIATMRKIRIAGEGPEFIQVGNGARYKLSVLQEFEGGGLLSQIQLARRWGITVRAVQKRDASGMLAGRVKMSGVVRYRLQAIEEIERQHSRAGGKLREPKGA
jgi:hypothetical protein